MSSSKSKKGAKVPENEHLPWLFLLLGAFPFLWIRQNADKAERFYFEHFEEIYTLGYLLLVGVSLGIIFLINKKTKGMSKRAKLLSPLWDRSWSNIEVGKTKDEIPLHLSDKDRCSHVQVIGTTGRGKTQSVVIPWALRDLNRGKSAVIIDGKGASDLPFEIFKEVKEAQLKCKTFHFNLGDSDNSIVINPLKSGSSQQITDRIFSSFEFEDPFYRALQYDICGYLTQLIHATKQDVSFKLLHKLLTDDTFLRETVSKLPAEHALRVHLKNHLRDSASDRKQKMAGLIGHLSPLANSEVAGIINGGANEINLGQAMLNSSTPCAFIYSIPTLKYQTMGHQLGKLLLQELAWCVGEREKLPKKEFTSVFLDEFSEFVYEGFISLLNKARSSKVGLHLCHQAISDLTKVSESFARSVNTNTNVKCILGLNDPDTADFYARHLGTDKLDKLTEQMEKQGFFNKSLSGTGRMSKREVEAYKVHPNTLKGLCQGKGVLHLPTDRGLVTEVIQFKSYSFWERIIVRN